MKSRRTTSLCSSSTRTSSRDDIDEVDGDRSSDESDSDDEKERVNDMPVTFEYVQGAPSPNFHFKLLKSAEPTSIAASASSQMAGASRKGVKASVSKTSSHVTISRKTQHQLQQLPEPIVDTSSEECSTKVEIANQSLFLKLLNQIRGFFSNRNNWTVTEESIIIWLGFMFFSVIVGCILHFLMA